MEVDAGHEANCYRPYQIIWLGSKTTARVLVHASCLLVLEAVAFLMSAYGFGTCVLYTLKVEHREARIGFFVAGTQKKIN